MRPIPPKPQAITRSHFFRSASCAAILLTTRPNSAIAGSETTAWPTLANPVSGSQSRRVVDPAGFLPLQDYERLERILEKLELDTGYAVRVLSRSRRMLSDGAGDYTDARQVSPVLTLRSTFNVTAAQQQQAILIVADRGIPGALEAGSSFLSFPYVGESARLALPDVFWGRLQREYGRRAFVAVRGEAASIVVTCELILSCLRNEEFCTAVPSAGSSFF
jgi:hypothetical protein